MLEASPTVVVDVKFETFGLALEKRFFPVPRRYRKIHSFYQVAKDTQQLFNRTFINGYAIVFTKFTVHLQYVLTTIEHLSLFGTFLLVYIPSSMWRFDEQTLDLLRSNINQGVSSNKIAILTARIISSVYYCFVVYLPIVDIVKFI